MEKLKLRLLQAGALAALATFALPLDPSAVALAQTGAESACPLVTDTDPRPMPQTARPGYLEPTTDPTFGTSVVRITDPGQPLPNPEGEPSLDGLVWTEAARHRYSSFSAWDADGALMAIPKGLSGYLFIDGNDYHPLFQVDQPGDVRWHPTKPGVMIYVNETEVGLWAPRGNETVRVFDLPGYSNFKWGRSSKAKGKPTYDGTKAIFIADRAYDLKNVGFVLDLETGEKSEDIDFRQYVVPDDNAGIYLSPLGQYYEVYGCVEGHEDERCNARIVFDIDGHEMWREVGYHIPGHWDYDVDENDQEWLIGLAKSGDYKGEMIKRSFRTGEIEFLADTSASHTSKRNTLRSSRVALMSKISRGTYDNEIVGVRLDGSGIVERYVHAHVVKNGYDTEPHASFSPDGRKFVFASNWDEKDGTIASYVVTLPQSCAESS